MAQLITADTIDAYADSYTADPVDRLRSAIDSAELESLTSYSLADAVREGCTVTRKLEGGWLQGNSACVMGAAAVSARARGYLG